MVRRVCRGLGTKSNIVVLNDEAHHCYRLKPAEELAEKLKGDDRKEAEQRNEAARVWVSGLEAVKRKIGVRSVYDVSATPFFLRGSGYAEGTLFPWVVSDFSLIDAIESGIVKVPRVPIDDNAMSAANLPTYRDLWLHVKDDLPKKGRGTDAVSGEPKLPKRLESALQSLYLNYLQYYERWDKLAKDNQGALTPPVFIVVCNNTNVSKLVYDYISGWDKPRADGSTVPVPGRLPLFSNVEGNRFRDRPNTILVDSEQLESGDAMSADFKQIASREIEEFKAELRLRFPGRDVSDLTDEDLLREVMNTVGKPGKLGEQIKCVVSVSMLTEGWDANTVTHVLGIRAFGTQLLCEQVVGRALRRMSYSPEPRTLTTPEGEVTFDAFAVEYAEVYGVPFSFINSKDPGRDNKPGPIPTRVRALEDRLDREITFPRLDGYRYDLPAERLEATFTADSQMTLSPQDIPTRVENAPIVGTTEFHTLDRLKSRREQEVAFHIARRLVEHHFPEGEQARTPWLFPDAVAIARQWLTECLHTKDGAFPQLLLFAELNAYAAEKVYHAIVRASEGEKRLLPITKPYDTIGTTRHVSFDTVRSTYKTRPDKCHVSHVVCDTGSWEQKMAQVLEEIDEVHSYVKNHNVGFFIPYTIDGQVRRYIPDFIARLDDGHGSEDLLNLIVEVTGAKDRDKEQKVSTAKTLWVPSVNNAGDWGRWAYLEIRDPWESRKALLSSIHVRERISQ